MNKQQLAQALYDAFITDKRTDGTEFVKLDQGSPEWMSDAIRAAHGDMLPDDVRYCMIREVSGAMSDCEDWDEERSERVDDMVDIYNADRLNWLSSSLYRAAYCDEARDEGLVSDDSDMFSRIGMGQYQEYDEIWGLLASALENVEEDNADQ